MLNTSLSHLLDTWVRLNRQYVVYHRECSQQIFVVYCRQFISCGGVRTTQGVYRTLSWNHPASLFGAETRERESMWEREKACVVQKYLKFSEWGPGGRPSRQFHNTVGSSCPQKELYSISQRCMFSISCERKTPMWELLTTLSPATPIRAPHTECVISGGQEKCRYRCHVLSYEVWLIVYSFYIRTATRWAQ